MNLEKGRRLRTDLQGTPRLDRLRSGQQGRGKTNSVLKGKGKGSQQGWNKFSYHIIQQFENTGPPKDLYVNAHSTTTLVKEWKQLKCSSPGEWTTKCVYPYNGILFSSKKG